ncbi:hypothetical protein [Anaeromyxobacter oryzisoli]|uniref:hypothetical protein n=1 Tax=Anaeromyxobacter oryzisoli TaxID=2925408 RepID=UPI001F5A303F|nr:hypothetical protein [Anaeromyxobacter sp. SG63]
MKLAVFGIGIAALAAAGCGSSSCPTEVPKVEQVASCTVRPGTQVNVKVKLCPTCNQNPTSCQVDLSGLSQGQIFLDPIVETCESSCTPESAPTCAVSGPSCTFTAPTAEGTYTLSAISLTGPVNGTLTVSSTVTPSCTL